jgi:hypothetical protein
MSSFIQYIDRQNQYKYLIITILVLIDVAAATYLVLL